MTTDVKLKTKYVDGETDISRVVEDLIQDEEEEEELIEKESDASFEEQTPAVDLTHLEER